MKANTATKSSRSKYVIKNSGITLSTELLGNILNFINRTVFISLLGIEYNGVNSLFTDILTVLSFTELGIGNAIVFSMYKPLADNDTEKIKSLMKLYSKLYRIIGLVITVLGLCCIPFLHSIVGHTAYVKENLSLLFLLFLANTASSYFFVYKKSLIIADQKSYVVSIYLQVFKIVQIILQLTILYFTHQFILYLVTNIAISILSNIMIARKADKMYPFLKSKNVSKLDKSEVKDISTNIKSLFVYKVGGILINSTDNIAISVIINVVTVGLYSNYDMIVNIFNTLGKRVMESVMASVGNLNTESDSEKKEKVFYNMLFMSVWFYGFASVGLFLFLNPLIELWLGPKYVLNPTIVLTICGMFYVTNMHYPSYIFRTTAGLFKYAKFLPIIAAIINIAGDIWLGLIFGLAGIFLSTILTRLLTYEWVDPLIIYKRVFKKNPIWYFVCYGLYIIPLLANFFIIKYCLSWIHFDGWPGIIVKAVAMTVLFNAIFVAEFFWSKDFKAVMRYIKKVIFHN